MIMSNIAQLRGEAALEKGGKGSLIGTLKNFNLVDSLLQGCHSRAHRLNGIVLNSSDGRCR